MANSYLEDMISTLETLFLEGDLTIESLIAMYDNNKNKNRNMNLYNEFYTHMRNNISKINSLSHVNESQMKIIQWLDLAICKNKNCGCFKKNDVCVAVKKGIGGPECEDCVARKRKQKIDCRFRKKVSTVCCEDSDGFLCPVCYDNVECGNSLSKLPCGHCFHPDCVKHWLIHNKENCPICRLELNLQLDSLYQRRCRRRHCQRRGKRNMEKGKRNVEKGKGIKAIRHKIRKYIAKENVDARSKIIRTNGCFYYSNRRGFNYKRDNLVFPDYRVVTIVKITYSKPKPTRFTNKNFRYFEAMRILLVTNFYNNNTSSLHDIPVNVIHDEFHFDNTFDNTFVEYSDSYRSLEFVD